MYDFHAFEKNIYIDIKQAASCEGEGFKRRYKRSKLEMFKDYN